MPLISPLMPVPLTVSRHWINKSTNSAKRKIFTKIQQPTFPMPLAQICYRARNLLDSSLRCFDTDRWTLGRASSRWTWISQYQNVSILDLIGAKGDGGGGNNWSYKTCIVPVKMSPPTNQRPVFLQARTGRATDW